MDKPNSTHEFAVAVRRAGRLAACLALAATVGCSCTYDRKVPPPADPTQARTALKAALDAWQQGVKPEDLLKKEPPMIISDVDWRENKKLLSYQVQGDGEMFGITLRCGVQLVLEESPGQPTTKDVVYDIATSPKVSVTRHDP